MRRTLPVLLVVLALAPGAHASPPTPLSHVLLTDNDVQTVRRFGDRLLLLGAFQHIGSYVGSGVGMDPSSGAIDPAFPRFDGQVSDVIDDGSGGWYVGGSFLIDGASPTRHLAHVLASGALDPAFTDTSGDLVTALALADGKLYATRWFKGGVQAFDPTSGARIASFAQGQPQQSSELEVADGRVYVGGSNAVLALDPATGDRISAFDCTTCSSGQVSALAHDDTRLYVGERGGRLFAVSLANGTRDGSFSPQPGRADADFVVDNGPLVLAVDGSRLLVGGRKLLLGGPSSTLVALDKSTGAPDPSFASGFDQPVNDMVLRGDAIVASGGRENSSKPPVIATLDRATGAVQGTIDTSLDGPIDALAGTGSRIFVGGRFLSRATIRTNGVALVDAGTGALDPGFAVRSLSWGFYSPNVLATDHALVFWATTSRGFDQSTFGYRHETLRFKAISLNTGQPLGTFNAPQITYDPRARTFRSLDPGGQSYDPAVIGDGNRIYVGHVLGNPDTVWPRSRIQVLSAATGRTVRAFDLPLPGYLTSLAKRGSRLYAGGSFRRFRNGFPAHLATLAVSPYTGALDSSFDAHTHGPIYGLGIAANQLYLTGIFDRIYPIRQHNAASVDLVNGFVDPRFRPKSREPGGFLEFGTPLGLGPGLLDLPSYYASEYVNLVSPVTGRRVTLPFSTSNLTALLPIGKRYYVGAYLNIPFDWSGPSSLNLTGLAG